jgi:hypothetical protein
VKILILTATLIAGCSGQESNVQDLQKVYKHIQNEKIYPTQEEWSEKIRKESEDPDLPQDLNLKLSDAAMKKMKENPFSEHNCYSCKAYTGDDPNMRNE